MPTQIKCLGENLSVVSERVKTLPSLPSTTKSNAESHVQLKPELDEAVKLKEVVSTLNTEVQSLHQSVIKAQTSQEINFLFQTPPTEHARRS